MISDAEGLRRAYQNIDDNDGNYIYGNTLYTSGSTPPWRVFSDPKGVFRDWFYDDPLLVLSDWGTRRTYKYASQQQILKANPQIRRIVGHSLSASTTLQTDDDNPGKFKVTAYSTPIISPHIPFINDQRDERRVRGTWDPVAMFDGNAGKTINTTTLNPHNYQQLGAGVISPYFGNDIASANGYQNPDGSLSLFR